MQAGEFKKCNLNSSVSYLTAAICSGVHFSAQIEVILELAPIDSINLHTSKLFSSVAICRIE